LIAYFYELRIDELCFDLGLAVFEKHRQNLAKVRVQLVQRLALRMRAREARDEADEESRFRRAFDDSRERLHARQANT
jgi:hypothetical protein